VFAIDPVQPARRETLMPAERTDDLIWLRPERAALGRPPQHSRAEITAAAVALADRAGLDAVSMRQVAAELGTGAASLYRYLDNRDDLLDLMVDATGSEYVLVPPSGDWLTDLVTLGDQARVILRRHPWLAGLVLSRPVLGPSGIALMEHVLAILADHPSSNEAKLEAFAMLNAVTALFVQSELGSGTALHERHVAYLQHVLASGAHPRLAQLLAAGGQPPLAEPPAPPADRYPHIMRRILTGLLG
jgi:AcrR family transcriptional regulator